MRKSRGKKAWAVSILALALCAALTACAGDVPALDAAAYLQGRLDSLYHGTWAASYLELVNTTEAAAKADYEEKAKMEAEVFISKFGIEYPTDELRTRLAELYKQIFAKADYTVGTATQGEDGTYTVGVTVRPLDVMRLMYAAFPAFHDEFIARYADMDTRNMDDEEYAKWNETVYDLDYRNGLVDLFETLLPEMGYLDETAIDVKLEKNADTGVYALNSDDFLALDALIIEYTQLGEGTSDSLTKPLNRQIHNPYADQPAAFPPSPTPTP